MRRPLQLLWGWLLPLLLVSVLQAQTYRGKTLVQPSLVSDTATVVPGQPFQVGLLLETAPKWHTYWEYPGDAGIATSLKWDLPPGVAAGPIQWPLPERIAEPGDIEVYAYGEKVLLLTTIVVPKDFKEPQLVLKAKAAWLVCEEICIPGSADVSLTLPVGSGTAPQNQELFRTYLPQIPSADPPPYQLDWKQADGQITLSVSGLKGVSRIDLFPLPATNQEIGHPQGGVVKDDAAILTVKGTGPLRGVLVADTAQGRKGWFVSSAETPSTSPSNSPAASPAPTAAEPSFAAPEIGFLKALLYGLLGGLILNLMPCVLPVISLKIFGFIRQAGDHPEKIFRHGLSFFAGVLAFFLALAGLIIGLKATGHDVIWGSQFQHPWFIVTISVLVFAFALNLFGVFEITLPGQAATALDQASSGPGYVGSFAQGLFVTLLATPCTAPFLAPALGFAFVQPPLVILAIFCAIALGMGSPYLLLSAQPGWMKALPRPGAWMERLRQFMGFPLMGFLLWLLYIIGVQAGLETAISLSCFLLCVAIACWLYGAFCGPYSASWARLLSLALIVAVPGGGGYFFLNGLFASRPANSAPPANTGPGAADSIAWQPFSQAALDQFIADKKTVFVDFTADWCLSCKVNERTSINIPSVRAAFQETHVVPLKADFTNANPEIAAALKKYNRVGVPFYIIFPAGRADRPIILPEVLTPGIVLDALKKASS